MIKRIVLILLVIVALGAGAAFFLVPWNAVIENRLTAFLHTRGIDNVSFDVDFAGLHSASLSNIVIGRDSPLVLQSLAIDYDLRELSQGTLRDVAIRGLNITVLETDDGWTIAGLSDFYKAPGQANDKPALSLSGLIDVLPFDSVTIEDSVVTVSGKTVQTTLPLSATLQKGDRPTLSLSIKPSTVTVGSNVIQLGDIAVSMSEDQKDLWAGPWQIQSIVTGHETIPALQGAGDIHYDAALLSVNGDMYNEGKTHKAAFKAVYDGKVADNSNLTITAASFPFKEGVISTKNIVVPLQGKGAITIPVTVRKVSLDALMQTLTGQRVSATGTVSGSVPVIVQRNGGYSFGKGSLKADSQGLIQMPGDVIPGDNDQVELVREILENLHYSVFSAGVETTGGTGMVVKLRLEGNNPDVYNGRIVKLNVNLTGDLLDFVRQNAMLISNPEKLLKQD